MSLFKSNFETNATKSTLNFILKNLYIRVSLLIFYLFLQVNKLIVKAIRIDSVFGIFYEHSKQFK